MSKLQKWLLGLVTSQSKSVFPKLMTGSSSQVPHSGLIRFESSFLCRVQVGNMLIWSAHDKPKLVYLEPSSLLSLRAIKEVGFWREEAGAGLLSLIHQSLLEFHFSLTKNGKVVFFLVRSNIDLVLFVFFFFKIPFYYFFISFFMHRMKILRSILSIK